MCVICIELIDRKPNVIVTKEGEAVLFNGNIRYMQTRLMNPTTLASMPMLNAYKYDQLNRLKESRSYETGLSSAIWNPTTYGNSYYNAFNYDAMGNILTQVRHKRSGTKIEDMNYKYQYLDPTTKTKLQRNRLYHIYEPLSLSDLDATDIDNMGAYDSTAVNINVTNNYSYDEEGRLVKDKAEKINKIVWRVDGKVKEIQRMTGTTKWLKFDYDAMGHRIAKHVFNNTGTTLERSTYYILDAQGNQISTYDHEVVGSTAQFNLKERNIFGSSRIGSKQDSLNVLTATITQNYTQVLGSKYYEFSNHLGNVLTVFSDIKIAFDSNNDGVVDGFRAPIRNTADYSPFGIQLDGRTLSYVPPAPAPPSVTVVYQHKFDDNPSTHPYTTAPNQLNTKLTNVSWTNSQSSWTNFAGFTGKAIATNSATPDTTRLYLNLTVNSGFMLDVKSYSFYHRSSTTGYTNYQLLVNGILVGSGSIFVSSGSTLQSTGTINVANAVAGLTGSVTVTLKLFGGSNGNNATFRLDDFTLNGYTQEVQVYAEGYRYGFNGMEGDSEFKGQGNSYTTEFRQYDARLGRWLLLDPLMDKFPWQSPYCAMDNNPICLVDPQGDAAGGPGDGDDPKKKGSKTSSNSGNNKDSNPMKNAIDKVVAHAYSNLETPKKAVSKASTSNINGLTGSPLPIFEIGGNKESKKVETVPTSIDQTNGFTQLAVSTIANSSTFKSSLAYNIKLTPILRNISPTQVSTKLVSRVNTGFKLTGYGIGLWNAFALTNNYSDNKISGFDYSTEMGSNTITTFGGVYGLGWGIGWELGKHYGPSKWIGNDDTKYFE